MYDCGNGHARTQWAKADMGCDAYLFCPGPSLAQMSSDDLAQIKRPGIMSFAINTAYPKIKPDVWIGMDRVECYDYELWWESFPKIIRGGYQDMKCEGYPISKCPNVFAADNEYVSDRAELFKRRQHDVKFVWHKNTLAIALHIMVWMGAKKIHLVGCDLNGTKYYDGREPADDRKEFNLNLYAQQVEYLKWFAKEGKNHGVELVSCTSLSPINAFMDFIPFIFATNNSTKIVNTLGKSEKLHAIDAEVLYKKKIHDTMFDEGIDTEKLWSSIDNDGEGRPLVIETQEFSKLDLTIPEESLIIEENE